MELKLHIGYQQLLELIKQLPASQLKKLKADIDLIVPDEEPDTAGRRKFQEFLLKGPVMTDEQVKELRSALATHLAEKVTSEMDGLFESNQWGAEKIEEWSKEHMRRDEKE